MPPRGAVPTSPPWNAPKKAAPKKADPTAAIVLPELPDLSPDANVPERQAVIDRMNVIALKGAELAMTTLVQAAAGYPVGNEALRAAQYVINQVMGRPSEKEPVSEKDELVLSLINDVRSLRSRRRGDAAVLEADAV